MAQTPDLDTRLGRWLGSIIDRLVNLTNELVSSRIYFVGFILVTAAFMVPQFFLKHPLDPPGAFFPLTVLIYTLIGLWVENSMKVYQREQGEKQAEQMVLLFKIITDLSEANKKSVATLLILNKIAEASLLLNQKILDAIEDPDQEHTDEVGPPPNPQ